MPKQLSHEIRNPEFTLLPPPRPYVTLYNRGLKLSSDDLICMVRTCAMKYQYIKLEMFIYVFLKVCVARCQVFHNLIRDSTAENTRVFDFRFIHCVVSK